MNILVVIHLLAAFGLLNVWIFRFKNKTKYRGGNAKNMKEEFATYGLPEWFMYVVGTLKILIAIALIIGIWFESLTFPVASILAILMLGAISMHIKVRDNFRKIIPAIIMLIFSIALVLFG